LLEHNDYYEIKILVKAYVVTYEHEVTIGKTIWKYNKCTQNNGPKINHQT